MEGSCLAGEAAELWSVKKKHKPQKEKLSRLKMEAFLLKKKKVRAGSGAQW